MPVLPGAFESSRRCLPDGPESYTHSQALCKQNTNQAAGVSLVRWINLESQEMQCEWQEMLLAYL